MNHFVNLFDYKADPLKITIDFSASHVWDHSAVTAIAKAVDKYEQNGKTVLIVGLNEDSRRLLERSGLSGATRAS